MKELVKISDNFRKMAVKCVFAIFLFLATYILLIILANGFTALCAYCGFLLMISYPMWLTIIFGAGLISLGIFILIFNGINGAGCVYNGLFYNVIGT